MKVIIPLAFAALAGATNFSMVASSPTPTADPDPGLGWLWPTKEDLPPLYGKTVPGVSQLEQPKLNGEEWLQSIRQQSEEELMLLEQGRSSIQKYQANSHDCYKEAASMLQKGCKELTIKQEEKIHYAVRLTMCEVATANMNVPTSCSQAKPPSACVEALAQVPQLWTTYSGYFREVMAMCYAVRHQIERELVESLFYNLTLAQLVNTNLLQKHAQDMAALHAQELAALTTVSQAQEELKSQASELGKWAADMAKDVGGMSDEMGRVARSVKEIDRVQKEVDLALRASKEEVGKWVQWVRKDTVELRQGLQVVSQDMDMHLEMQKRAQESMQALVATIAHVFNATSIHTSSLATTLSRLNSSLTTHASTLDVVLRSQLAHFDRLATSISRFESHQNQVMHSTSAWFAQVQQMHASIVESMTAMAEHVQETQFKQTHQLDSVTQALRNLHEQTEAATSSFEMMTKIVGFLSGNNMMALALMLGGVVTYRLLGPVGGAALLAAIGFHIVRERDPSWIWILAMSTVAVVIVCSLVWAGWHGNSSVFGRRSLAASSRAGQDEPVASSASSTSEPLLLIRTLQRPPKRNSTAGTHWKRYRPSQLFSLSSSQRSNQSE